MKFIYGLLTTTALVAAATLSSAEPSPEASIQDEHGAGTPLSFEWTFDAEQEVTLDVDWSSRFNFTVDWGDGTEGESRVSDADDRTAVADAATHHYAAGTYRVTVTGSIESMKFHEPLTRVFDLGDMGWKSMAGMFAGCTQLTTVSGGDVSNVTDMSRMFEGALEANPDTSSWDVSNVTDMSRMFEGALEANPDTSSWDVSSVTDMSYMFKDALSASPDTSAWDVSSVSKLSGIISGAPNAHPDTRGWHLDSLAKPRSSSIQPLFIEDTHGEWENVDALSKKLPDFYEQGYRILFVEMVPHTLQRYIDDDSYRSGPLADYINAYWHYGYTGTGLHPYLRLIEAGKAAGFKVLGLDEEYDGAPRTSVFYMLSRVKKHNPVWARNMERALEEFDEPFLVFGGGLHCYGFSRANPLGIHDLMGTRCLRWKANKQAFEDHSEPG